MIDTSGLTQTKPTQAEIDDPDRFLGEFKGYNSAGNKVYGSNTADPKDTNKPFDLVSTKDIDTTGNSPFKEASNTFIIYP